MSAVPTTTLTFRTHNLETDATLLLMFDNKTDGMYDSKFPVCWKVTALARTGSFQIRVPVVFESEMAFCKPLVDYSSYTIVDAGIFTKINVGQKTTLIKDDSDVCKFIPPEADGGSTMLTVFNGTQFKEDMGFGFFKDPCDTAPTPVYFFNGILPGSPVREDFKPILRAYVTFRSESIQEFQEMQILRDELVTPVLWEQNLTELYHDTFLGVNYDAASGKFTITPA